MLDILDRLPHSIDLRIDIYIYEYFHVVTLAIDPISFSLLEFS